MGWIYIDNTRLCNLGLKSPLCWKQLNHTKDNQSSNTKNWAMCLIDSANI